MQHFLFSTFHPVAALPVRCLPLDASAPIQAGLHDGVKGARNDAYTDSTSLEERGPGQIEMPEQFLQLGGMQSCPGAHR